MLTILSWSPNTLGRKFRSPPRWVGGSIGWCLALLMLASPCRLLTNPLRAYETTDNGLLDVLPTLHPISRPCTFPPAHWWLILLINYFSLVIGGKLHSEYLGFSLLVANYSRNIPFFLPWQPGSRHIPYVH